MDDAPYIVSVWFDTNTNKFYTLRPMHNADQSHVIPISLCTKTAAALARKLLKHHFPASRFSVRTSYFTGGSSIEVQQTGGEPVETRNVSVLLRPLSCRSFDPTCDMTTVDAHLYMVFQQVYKPFFGFVNVHGLS